jgi:hypothetical protein
MISPGCIAPAGMPSQAPPSGGLPSCHHRTWDTRCPRSRSKRAAELARRLSEQQREAMKAPTATATPAPIVNRPKATALPKVTVRKPERAPWKSVRAVQAPEAKDVGDLDPMLRVFREQVDPMYRRASRLVRDRIKKDVAQRFEQIDR